MAPVSVDVRSGPAAATAASPAMLAGVLADPLRWRILTLLSDAELCTTHLQDLLEAKQTLVSHHLRVLREAGLVLTAPCGRFTYYRLRPGALDELAGAVRALAVASRRDVAKRPCL
jgi:ArsR family transcriptional regulator, arsenate/arsenite/antimonite-responsive transcriptional repressor